MLAGLDVVLLGCFLSIAISVLRTSNPARIPLRRIAFRSSFGLFLWFGSAGFVGCLAWQAVRLSVLGARLRSDPLQIILFTFVLGITVPHLGILKDIIFSYSVARRMPRTFRMLQTFDEVTRLYTQRIIAREERKVNQEFFDVNLPLEELGRRTRALYRLFEFHQIEIALDRRNHGEGPDKILSPFRFRKRDLKFKLLLRFLGCSRALQALEALSRHPDLLRERERPGAQIIRTLESPYVKSYVLGHDI